VPPTFLDIVEVVMQCEDRQPIRVVSPRGYRKTFRHNGSLDTALGAVALVERFERARSSLPRAVDLHEVAPLR
jgi:hypothetical protein